MKKIKLVSIIIVSILTIALIVLSFLGSKERTGYIEVLTKIEDEFVQSSWTDTNYNWVNGVNEKDKVILFSPNIANKMILDRTQYLVSGATTNEVDRIETWGDIHVYLKNVTNLKDFEYPNKIHALDKDKKVFNDENIYQVRIRYYSKLFRNSDIYGVYLKTDNLPEYVKHIEFDETGTPYGFIFSSKDLSSDNKIDNISYVLKVRDILKKIAIAIIMILFLVINLKYINNLSRFNWRYTEQIYFDKKYNKFYNSIFFIFVLFISTVFLSIAFAIPIRGDDWLMSSNYPFYHIFKFDGYFWQRGRHIADMLMSIGMRPFGRILIGFGIDAILSQRIMQSVLSTLFRLMGIFSLSLFVYLLNNKHRFRTSFIFISIFSTILFSNYAYLTPVAAYVMTAALSFTIWIPLAYYWIYERELDFFKQNRLLCYSIYIVALYFASFVIEQSSLAVAGLSGFMLLYFLLRDRFKMFENNNKIKTPKSIYYILIAHIFLVISAFVLTLNSGRGKTQIERINDNVSIFERIINQFRDINNFTIIIIIIGILYLLLMIIKSIKSKYITKKDYISISLIITGFLGIISFISIKVSYSFEVIFVWLGLFIKLLDLLKHKYILAYVCVPILFVISSFQLFIIYDAVLFKNNEKSDRVLANLFLEADKNNQTNIVLTYHDITNLRVIEQWISPDVKAFPNRDISTWMKMYGYTKEYITIQVTENKELEKNETDD